MAFTRFSQDFLKCHQETNELGHDGLLEAFVKIIGM